MAYGSIGLFEYENIRWRVNKMSFGMIIIMILGAGLAIATTGYLCVSIFAVIGYKLFRKIKYGTSIFN